MLFENIMGKNVTSLQLLYVLLNDKKKESAQKVLSKDLVHEKTLRLPSRNFIEHKSS